MNNVQVMNKTSACIQLDKHFFLIYDKSDVGSYDQLISVICDLIHALFFVVTLYYWYQHVALLSQMTVHLLHKTHQQSNDSSHFLDHLWEIFETTFMLGKHSSGCTKACHSATAFHAAVRYKNQGIHHQTEACTLLCCSSGIQFPPPSMPLFLMTSTTEGKVSGRQQRVDLQLQHRPGGNLALCHQTALQEESSNEDKTSIQIPEALASSNHTFIRVSSPAQNVCCCCCCWRQPCSVYVYSCVTLRGRNRVETLNVFFSSDHCATQYHLGSFKKIKSTAGIYSHTVVAQGKKHPFIKKGKKSGSHFALVAKPVMITLLGIQIKMCLFGYCKKKNKHFTMLSKFA